VRGLWTRLQRVGSVPEMVKTLGIYFHHPGRRSMRSWRCRATIMSQLLPKARAYSASRQDLSALYLLGVPRHVLRMTFSAWLDPTRGASGVTITGRGPCLTKLCCGRITGSECARTFLDAGDMPSAPLSAGPIRRTASTNDVTVPRATATGETFRIGYGVMIPDRAT